MSNVDRLLNKNSREQTQSHSGKMTHFSAQQLEIHSKRQQENGFEVGLNPTENIESTKNLSLHRQRACTQKNETKWKGQTQKDQKL